MLRLIFVVMVVFLASANASAFESSENRALKENASMGVVSESLIVGGSTLLCGCPGFIVAPILVNALADRTPNKKRMLTLVALFAGGVVLTLASTFPLYSAGFRSDVGSGVIIGNLVATSVISGVLAGVPVGLAWWLLNPDSPDARSIALRIDPSPRKLVTKHLNTSAMYF